MDARVCYSLSMVPLVGVSEMRWVESTFSVSGGITLQNQEKELDRPRTRIKFFV